MCVRACVCVCVFAVYCSHTLLQQYIREIGDFMSRPQNDGDMASVSRMKEYCESMLRDISSSYDAKEEDLKAALEFQAQNCTNISNR